MVLMQKSECKRPFERSKRRWGDNNKTDLTEIGWCGLDWINVVRRRNGERGGVVTRSNTLWGFVNISSFLTS